MDEVYGKEKLNHQKKKKKPNPKPRFLLLLPTLCLHWLIATVFHQDNLVIWIARLLHYVVDNLWGSLYKSACSCEYRKHMIVTLNMEGWSFIKV